MDTAVDTSIDRTTEIGYTFRSVFTPGEPLAHIIPLNLENEDAQEEFETQQYIFWRGHCIPFAAAVHRITGWEMIAIDTAEYSLSHCGVRSPSGDIWDGRGSVTPEEFIEGHMNAVPEAFRVVTWSELRDAWPPIDLPGTERLVSRMYPNLPHLPTSDRELNLAFMNEVEALCRRRNYWIVAQQRGSLTWWPVIGEAFGEEVGYRATNTHGEHLMDRMLRSEQGRGPSHLSHGLDRFLQELADLSRKHGLWIRAGLPTTWPRIIRLHGEEQKAASYVMRQTPNVAGFLTTLR